MGLFSTLFGGGGKPKSKFKDPAKEMAKLKPEAPIAAVNTRPETMGPALLYQAKELERILKEQPEEVVTAFRVPTLTEAAGDKAAAVNWLLARLRTDAKLRAQFPRALSDGAGGAFANWLHGVEAPKYFKFNADETLAWPRVRGFFSAALAEPPGQEVLRLWLLKKNWQAKYPLLPCQADIRDVLRWMLRRGPAEFDLSREAVLWFFQEWAEKPEEAAALVYRVRPEWQKQFPVLIESATQQKIFIRWAKENASLELDLDKLAAALSRQPEEVDPEVPATFEPRLKQVLKATGESLLPMETGQQPKRLGINLLGTFCYPSGSQQSAVEFNRAARLAGLAVSTRDVPVEAERRSLPRTPALLGMEHHEVTVFMLYPNAMFPQAYELAGLAPRVGVRRVGYWYWESETVPEEVVKMAEPLHEIWVATEYIAQAFRTHIPRKPVHVLLPSVETPRPAALDRRGLGLPVDEKTCLFGFVFDMSSTLIRKNALGLLGAFSRAFGDDDPGVFLVIKTQRGELFPEDYKVLEETCATYSNVLLVNESWPIERVYALIRSLDCYISLHRSEGLGLTLAEAMLMGKPVIATNYSGNLDFMDEQVALMVPARKTMLAVPNAAYMAGTAWSEPDLDRAAEHMRWVRANPGAARELGARGQRHARDIFSAEAAAARIRERVAAAFLAAHETQEVKRVEVAAMNAISARRLQQQQNL
jgi:glycosyltransferase involved in cell wall biosynthesis